MRWKSEQPLSNVDYLITCDNKTSFNESHASLSLHFVSRWLPTVRLWCGQRVPPSSACWCSAGLPNLTISQTSSLSSRKDLALRRRNLPLVSSKDNLLVAKMDPSQRKPSMKVVLYIYCDIWSLVSMNDSQVLLRTTRRKQWRRLRRKRRAPKWKH